MSSIGLCQIWRRSLFPICLGAPSPSAVCSEPSSRAINFEAAKCFTIYKAGTCLEDNRTGTQKRHRGLERSCFQSAELREAKHSTRSGVPFLPGCFESLSGVGSGSLLPARLLVNLWADHGVMTVIFNQKGCLVPYARLLLEFLRSRFELKPGVF